VRCKHKISRATRRLRASSARGKKWRSLKCVRDANGLVEGFCWQHSKMHQMTPLQRERENAQRRQILSAITAHHEGEKRVAVWGSLVEGGPVMDFSNTRVWRGSALARSKA